MGGKPQSRTTSLKALASAMRHQPDDPELAVALKELELARPRTREHCAKGIRPCPFVGCKHHIAIEVHPSAGSLKERFPGVDLEDIPETCALDVADRGGITLEEVGAVLGMTRERVRQIESSGLSKLRRRVEHESDEDVPRELAPWEAYERGRKALP